MVPKILLKTASAFCEETTVIVTKNWCKRTIVSLKSGNCLISMFIKFSTKSSLWVTGGIGEDHSEMNSTELFDLKQEKSIRSQITLPENLQLHCLVKINEKQVLLIGGLRFVSFHIYQRFKFSISF